MFVFLFYYHKFQNILIVLSLLLDFMIFISKHKIMRITFYHLK